jgi:hypothetical protein
MAENLSATTEYKYSSEEVSETFLGLIGSNPMLPHHTSTDEPGALIYDALFFRQWVFREIPLSQLVNVTQKLKGSPLYETKDGCHLGHYLIGRIHALADLKGVGGLLEEIGRTGLLDARQEPKRPKRPARSVEDVIYRNSPEEVRDTFRNLIGSKLEGFGLTLADNPETFIRDVLVLREVFEKIPLSQLDNLAGTLKYSRLYDTEDGRCLWNYLIGKIQMLEEVSTMTLKQFVRMID